MDAYQMSRKTFVASGLLLALFACVAPALAEEETPPPADAPANVQEIVQQAKDGDVPMPRATTKIHKPNRALMKMGVANTKVGLSFLADNQQKPGVVTLKSGLQYKVVKAGAGKKPTGEDIVKCNYVGKLLDDTVFEQSEPGKPANVKLAGLVPGLNEAIKLMPVGSKWEIYIPSELGFGVEGRAPKVGPDAVLIYEIELLGIGAGGTEKR